MPESPGEDPAGEIPCPGRPALAYCNSLSGMAMGELYGMREAAGNAIQTQNRLVHHYYRLALWVILAFLFALDIITTTISLQQGNFEKNPFMIPFANSPLLHGIVKTGAFIALFIVIEKAVLFIQERQPEKMPFWIKLNFHTLYGMILFALLSLIVLYFYILINNIQVIF
jgi:hypothetical protein